MDKKAFYFDLLERTGWTFAQGFAAMFIIHGHLDEHVFQVAGVAGLIAVAKSLVAAKLPWTASDSASTLPEHVDPPQ